MLSLNSTTTTTVCIVLMLAGCINPAFHQVNVIRSSCIKPHKRYHYYTCDTLSTMIDGQIYDVPPYFDTDLASIPRWYWSILSPRYSSFVYPSILHDYFYSCPTYNITRKFADDVFYWALINQGISKFTATKMYIAVRLFGGFFFQKKRMCSVGFPFLCSAG